ncbi:MAG: FtsX-like permease family protein [bacterium]|nr:FtsX-like permease family protein [bacterium]
MIPAFSPFLALRYLLRRPIMLIGVFGVTFAVWSLLVVDGIFTGFVTEIRADVRRSTPDVLVTDLPHDTSYERLRAVIAADPAVRATAPRLRHQGILQPRPAPRGSSSPTIGTNAVNFEDMTMDSGFALLLGVDPLREPEVTPLGEWLDRSVEVLHAHSITRARRSEVLEDPDPDRRSFLLTADHVEWDMRRIFDLPRPERVEDHRSEWPGMIAGWRRLTSLKLIEQGYPIDLMTASFDVAGDGSAQVNTRRIPMAFGGYFATSHRMFDQSMVLVPIETLRTLLGHDIEDDEAIDIVTDVAVAMQPGLSAGELSAAKSRIRTAVASEIGDECAVIDWREQNSVFLRAIAQEHSMMQFVLFVVMIVAAFVIYATLHMMVVQKWKDIGILAAIGGTRRGIGAVFVFCGLVVGSVGATIGSVLGWLSVHYLNDINDWFHRTTGASLFPRHLFDLPVIPVHLELSWVIQVALGAVLLALLVALLPARKAARMEPVAALSYE